MPRSTTILRKVIIGSIPALFLLAPFAGAHFPARPDTTCSGEVTTHDFALGPGVQGYVPTAVAGMWYFSRGSAWPMPTVADGNLAQCADPTYGMLVFNENECAGTSGNPPGSVNPAGGGDPLNAIKLLDGGPANVVHQVACETDRPADWDGDFEWGIGGALLAVQSYGPITGPPQSCNYVSGNAPCHPSTTGSLVEQNGGFIGGANNCWDMNGHHSGIVTAELDDPTGTFRNYVTLSVVSNYRRAAFDLQQPALFPCGDPFIEPCPDNLLAVDQVTCNGRDGESVYERAVGDLATVAAVPGPAFPGQDGAWVVFVGSACQAVVTAVCVPTPTPTLGWTGHIST